MFYIVFLVIAVRLIEPTDSFTECHLCSVTAHAAEPSNLPLKDWQIAGA